MIPLQMELCGKDACIILDDADLDLAASNIVKGVHHCNASNFGLQGLKDSRIGSQGVTNNINMMTKLKSTVINLPTPSFAMG
ncbi:hypothetical protein L2E82_48081 [Cichorium intybus]|uniref:Uncharacterized protein n=1 Tax=Cichorium intybus TaxID=13427 RepID=A0ACB8YXZ9_CICIN|nr:hypothetical protein L2E82_48081 [Cichorium intybus]